MHGCIVFFQDGEHVITAGGEHAPAVPLPVVAEGAAHGAGRHVQLPGVVRDFLITQVMVNLQRAHRQVGAVVAPLAHEVFDVCGHVAPSAFLCGGACDLESLRGVRFRRWHAAVPGEKRSMT